MPWFLVLLTPISLLRNKGQFAPYLPVEMQFHLFSTMPWFLVLLTPIFICGSTPVFAADYERYLNCMNSFDCGNIRGISYPFWGSNRPDYCGYPDFKVDCNGQNAEITIMPVSYNVLGIDFQSQSLNVSRKDYSMNICPSLLYNSTLNTKLFNYSSDVQNISIYYGCPSPTPSFSQLATQFVCKINTTDMTGYFITANLTQVAGVDPNVIDYVASCKDSVQVPVHQSSIQSMNINATEVELVEALKLGFGLKWNATLCDECESSGGRCGYNRTTSAFTCFCKDQPHPLACPPNGQSTRSRKTNRRLVIAIVIPATVTVIVAVYVILKHFTGRLGSSSGKIVGLWWKDTKQNQKLEAFMVNYHSLTPKRYSYSNVKKMTNSFNTKLGQGGFGCVYGGKLLDGRLVAVKVLTKFKTEGEEFINEVASISRTSHVNIVTLLGFCLERRKKALIYEYMPNGSLDKFISYGGCPHTNRLLEWKTLYEIAVGIARGLEYLHRGCNTRIVHFDIKPHNILLDEDFCPKISDFGLAKLCKRVESKVSLTGTRGTAGYIAPEVFFRNFGGISYKSDVYSYGMMILEMVGERKKTDVGLSETSETYFPDWIYKHLEPGEISRLQEGITEENEEIARKMILVGLWCIQFNPLDRPCMTKVVEMLEGSLQSMQIPPKPSFPSPQRSLEELLSTTSSLPNAWSQKDEEKKLSVDEGDM